MASSTQSSVWTQISSTPHAAAYVHYGFAAIPDLLRHAATIVDADPLTEIEETRLDARYATMIPNDQALVKAFSANYESHPDAYAPLTSR